MTARAGAGPAASDRRVPAAFAVPELRPLWDEAHRRLASGRRVSRVSIGPLTEEQRDAVADLLGMATRPAPRCTVPLQQLESVVQDAGCADVRHVVDALVGPVGDRAGDRAAERAAREALWAWLEGHPAVRGRAGLRHWCAAQRARGVVGSVERTRRELVRTLAVIDALPADGIPLAVLAEQVLGDPHGLDEGTWVSALVLQAISFTQDDRAATSPGADPTAPDGGGDPRRGALRRRHLWETVGVTSDQLSSTVLVAGLDLDDGGLVGTLAVACREAAQACALTLAQVERLARLRSPVDAVLVVENPSVLSLALARLGGDCPPLVCGSGWPNSAVLRLLGRLRDHGTTVLYHGDFDPEGLRICGYLQQHHGVVPWRMGAPDYRAALNHDEGAGVAIDPDRVPQTPWDPGLAAALAEHRQAVYEERLVDELLAGFQAWSGTEPVGEGQ